MDDSKRLRKNLDMAMESKVDFFFCIHIEIRGQLNFAFRIDSPVLSCTENNPNHKLSNDESQQSAAYSSENIAEFFSFSMHSTSIA